jgi:peptidoglycan biosynthesis protein MviN/MurJ (putative lipid II flippase)
MQVFVIVAAITALFEVLLVGPYGPIGVAIASAAGTVASNVALLFLARKRLGIWTATRLSPGSVRRVLSAVRRA